MPGCLKFYQKGASLKLLNYLLLFGLVTSCVRSQAPEATSTVMALDEFGCKLDDNLFPEFLTFGDPQWISWLSQLGDCERRKLLINAEGAAVSGGDLASPSTKQYAKRLIPLTLPHVEAPLELLQIKGLEGDGGILSDVADPEGLQRIGRELGVIVSGKTIKIPVHPTTKSQHPLIQWLIDQNYPLVTDQSGPSNPPKTIGTMSRSLWYLPSNRVTTIKLGSDFINGRKSPTKLTDVARDVSDLQDILQNTTIPDFMADLEVTYLVDSKAMTLSTKNDRGGMESMPYGVALRDYSRLLHDKQRIYIPLALLEDRTRSGEGCDDQKLIPYGFSRAIKIPLAQLESMLYKLNQTLARVIAIHHANGYMPIDFHGQNLLVGIPLDPQVPPRLVIRDVSDIYPFQFEKTTGSTWGGIKKVQARGIRLPNLDLDQAVAYKDQMKRIGFKVENRSWDQVPAQYSIRDMARQYYEYNQAFFWTQVEEFRTKKCTQLRPQRAPACVVRARAFAGAARATKPPLTSVLKN